MASEGRRREKASSSCLVCDGWIAASNLPDGSTVEKKGGRGRKVAVGCEAVRRAKLVRPTSPSSTHERRKEKKQKRRGWATMREGTGRCEEERLNVDERGAVALRNTIQEKTAIADDTRRGDV